MQSIACPDVLRMRSSGYNGTVIFTRKTQNLNQPINNLDQITKIPHSSIYTIPFVGICLKFAGSAKCSWSQVEVQHAPIGGVNQQNRQQRTTHKTVYYRGDEVYLGTERYLIGPAIGELPTIIRAIKCGVFSFSFQAYAP